MPLSDAKCRTAKLQAKPYKLTDEKGLYLLITPAGGKLWRFDYRFAGKRKTLALGSYPDLPLSEARARLADARQKLAGDIDPGAARKAEKQAQTKQTENTFKAIATEWYNSHSSRWALSYQERMQRLLFIDLCPWIGDQQIAEITPQALLTIARRIEERGAAETAHRALQTASVIFRYAVSTLRATSNPVDALRGALAPVAVKHHPSIIEPAQVGALLRAIDGYQGTLISRCAMRLLPLVFTRPGELRAMEWAEIDFPAALWSIPAGKMKMRESHIVPLSRQALAILAEIQPLTGGGQYVFPSERSTARCLSENTINAALRRLGYSKEEIVPHGFRAMARTLLDEALGYRVDYVEQQLAHEVKDPLGRAYNRTKHLDERRRMMQAWADYLEGLQTDSKPAANVLSFKAK